MLGMVRLSGTAGCRPVAEVQQRRWQSSTSTCTCVTQHVVLHTRHMCNMASIPAGSVCTQRCNTDTDMHTLTDWVLGTMLQHPTFGRLANIVVVGRVMACDLWKHINRPVPAPCRRLI